jgi:hypothetical protein
MGLKEWKQKRKEKKEQNRRMDFLNEQERDELLTAEKKSYFNVARKQVKLRGKINAYKDFPVDNLTNIKLEDEEKEEPEIDKKISREFAEGKFDEEIINAFKAAFYENPNLTFSEFQNIYETSLSEEELREKEGSYKKEQERLELNKLKEDQEKQDKLYQDYLKLPGKEFERKRRKERRGKLSRIDLKSSDDTKIEISKETSEKIEKFKSSFDRSIRNRYTVQENGEKSPIDLIRERKKKKSEEFKRYEKHFEED